MVIVAMGFPPPPQLSQSPCRARPFDGAGDDDDVTTAVVVGDSGDDYDGPSFFSPIVLPCHVCLWGVA